MNYFSLLLPTLVIIGLFVGLLVLKRRLFNDEPTQAPIPIPDIHQKSAVTASAPQGGPAAARPAPGPATPTNPSPAFPGSDDTGLSLTPARLYPCRVLSASHKAIFSRLLKALPGYVVLPGITYDRFLEARDGTPSENTSLQNRAGQQLADFVVCDRKLNVLLVCQVEDGSVLPARIQEREKMLHRAGLRLLRWNVDAPPDADKLLNTVRTLEKLSSGTVAASG